MKNSLLSLIIFALGSTAYAAPILNRGTPAGAGILIYPDHLDKNLYYLNPTSIGMARDEKGVPLFSYTEYFAQISWGAPYSAIIQVMMTPTVNSELVQKAQESIKILNPNAVFSALPFHESHIILTPDLKKLINPNSCTHRAGVMGQLQDCTIDLTPAGRRVIRPMLLRGMILSVQFEYTISGMNEKPDGTFEAAEASMGVGGYIGGPELSQHPELFRFIR